MRSNFLLFLLCCSGYQAKCTQLCSLKFRTNRKTYCLILVLYCQCFFSFSFPIFFGILSELLLNANEGPIKELYRKGPFLSTTNKAFVEGQSPPQELPIGLHSGSYLLVLVIRLQPSSFSFLALTISKCARILLIFKENL